MLKKIVVSNIKNFTNPSKPFSLIFQQSFLILLTRANLYNKAQIKPTLHKKLAIFEHQQNQRKMLRVGEALSISTSSASSLYESDEAEEIQKIPPKTKAKHRLSKQLPILEIKRDNAWEKRRRQMMLHHLEKKQINGDDLTDEDLSELKGSIELGFGFNEEEAQKLISTLPALDLYFALSRQISPLSSPLSGGSSSSSIPSSLGDLSSPRSDCDGLKLMSPGDNPQQVKKRLRHWAQAVACSVKQQSYNPADKCEMDGT